MITNVTTGGLLCTAAARHPERTAVVFAGFRQTYRQLMHRVDHWARRLVAHGVEQGDHVGMLMTNSPAYIELLYAIGSVGAVAVPINPRYRAAELAYVLGDSDISLLIVGDPPSGELSLLGRLADAVPEIARTPAGEGLRVATAPRLRRVAGLATSAYPAVENLDAVAADTVTLDCLRERCARTRVRDAALIMSTSAPTVRPDRPGRRPVPSRSAPGGGTSAPWWRTSAIR